ncbi:hypothetical protein ACHWQZ_G009068 [Mnemiopsis leidyi]
MASKHWLLLFLLLQSGQTAAGDPQTAPDTSCKSSELAAQLIRREGYAAIDRADAIREQAYRVMEEALEMKESALEAKSALETMDIEDKVDDLEDKIEGVKERMDKQDEKIEESFAGLGDQASGIEEKINEQGTLSRSISERLTETLSTAQTLKTRQAVRINEVRLISLYKRTGSNNPHSSYDDGVIVDGMVTFDRQRWGDMRTYTHNANTDPGNKVWVELGGLFKIHSVKVWNLRHCCMEKMVGTQVYVDDTIVGAVVHTQPYHDFIVDGVYGREVMSSWDELLNFVKEEENVNPTEHVTEHVTNTTRFNTDNLNVKLADGTEFKIHRPDYLPVTFGRLEWADNLSHESLFRSLGVALMPEGEETVQCEGGAEDSKPC